MDGHKVLFPVFWGFAANKNAKGLVYLLSCSGAFIPAGYTLRMEGDASFKV